jgi:glyoxylase-like metal-dependent hydrolase (beta-lactamase superfamily II)
MHEVLPGLWRLSLFPLNALNVYLLGRVLVDTGAPFTKNKLLKRLEGKTVEAVAVTHAHFDHQGACDAVCESLNIPLWCGSRERTALENGI